MARPLLEFDDTGIYCSSAGVYIDPWKPVDRALVTHGHADHARWGCKHYLCHRDSEAILRHRLGADISVQAVPYGDPVVINGVRFSFHPAGHIPGSAQIRVEAKGEVWVASGDYKLEDDGLCTPFEPVTCHTFITESTFGLPVYQWKPQQTVYDEINAWWKANAAAGKATVITGYSLGKAQRLLTAFDQSLGEVFVHGAIANMNEVIQQHVTDLPPATRVSAEIPKERYRGALILAPPSAVGSPWMKKFLPYSVGIASGWMSLRGARRRRAVDRGFVLSDHADWPDLNKAIQATGAEKVIVTHGYTSTFAQWLQTQGYEAYTAETQFEGELGEISESSTPTEEAA